MVPLNELAVFVAVVEAGSLTAAARQLGMSKAAVSDQIKRLEAALDARLLNRTTRRLSLTQAGQACYAHAVRMVAEADAAARAASVFHGEPKGVLRLAAPTTFAPQHIVPSLPAFRSQNPHLSIDLRLSAESVDIIQERFDLAIRIGALPDSRLIAKRLAVSRIILCAAESYLRGRGMPLDAAELSRHDMLEFAPLGWRGRWRLVGTDGKSRTVAVTPVLVSDSGEALLAAAIAGLGVAALPNWMVASDLRAGGLTHVLPGWGGRGVPINAVYPSTIKAAAKVRLFIDHLARHLSAADWRV